MWTRLVAGAAALLLPSISVAQAEPPPPRLTGLVWGGEISGAISRRDDRAFFNYAYYEHDTLRHVRLRLMAESRLPGRVDLLAEVRSDNETAGVPALFVRWQPAARMPLFLEAGRVPLVLGAFSRRAYGTENLLVGMPLAYQYLTSLRPDALPATVDDVLQMRARGWRPSYPIGSTSTAAGLPVIAFSRGDAGVQAQWRAPHWSVAAAVTLGTPADPRWRDNNSGLTVSGRAAINAPSGLTAGVSAARGRWVDEDAEALLDQRQRFGASQQVVGADAEFARGHWIVRGEWWRSRFEVPTLATPLTATTGFVEGRYRFRPRWQVAARVDRIAFSRVSGSAAASLPWDAPVWRIEGVADYRVSRRLNVRAGWQHNRRTAGRVRSSGFPTLQAVLWF
jgi:hypothetical protein